MAQRAINTCDIAHCTEHPLGFAVAMDSYPVGDFLFLFLLLFSFFFLFFSLLRSRDIPWVREIFPLVCGEVTGSCLGVFHWPTSLRPKTRGYYLIEAVWVCAAPSGRVFEPFWSDNGYTLCRFWSGIGFGFEGTTRVYERIYRSSSKWVRKKKNYANSKWNGMLFLLALISK